ncbi:MAG: thiosulfate oxidation carrier protein SoxY [Chromatiaceae bacterium]|nr:thiosulfate oxidation carrier protein SoxY [Chromatiaceae bacterium]
MMETDVKRRILLKGSMAAGALGVAVAAGLLTPTRVIAAWPDKAFAAKAMPDMLLELMGGENPEESADIKIKAPDIAENGAVVPVTISTTIAGAQSIAVIAMNNPAPLVASYDLGEGVEGFVSTRIKMGKSGDVVAVVKADGKLYSAKKGVKVTIGGCGG